MKNLLLLIVLVIIGYFFWSKYRPAPEPWIVAVEPTPIPKRLAPEGVHFTLEYVSVTTPTGISGIKPGTKVTEISRDGDSVRVTDGSTEFDMRSAQITNDLDIAARVGYRDAVSQHAIRSAIALRGPIAVMQATYGYGSQKVDVTHRVRVELQGGNTRIRAGSHLSNSDPAPGHAKTLSIWYSVGDRSGLVANIREGDSVDLAPGSTARSTPTPEIRYVPAATPRQNSLDRGAYDEKKGVAKPPIRYWVP